jgi:hypothetical protein
MIWRMMCSISSWKHLAMLDGALDRLRDRDRHCVSPSGKLSSRRCPCSVSIASG